MRVEDINSVDSEAGIIASLIHNPELYFYSEQLLPLHFVKRDNRYVYLAISKLVKNGINTVDPYNIIEVLSSDEATRKFADELSIDRLQELMEMSDVLARRSVEEYKILVSNVLDAAFRRDAYQRLEDCQKLCLDRGEENVEQKIYEAIDDIMTSYTNANDIPSYSEVVDDCWNEIRERQGAWYSYPPRKDSRGARL